MDCIYYFCTVYRLINVNYLFLRLLKAVLCVRNRIFSIIYHDEAGRRFQDFLPLCCIIPSFPENFIFAVDRPGESAFILTLFVARLSICSYVKLSDELELRVRKETNVENGGKKIKRDWFEIVIFKGSGLIAPFWNIIDRFNIGWVWMRWWWCCFVTEVLWTSSIFCKFFPTPLIIP